VNAGARGFAMRVSRKRIFPGLGSSKEKVDIFQISGLNGKLHIGGKPVSLKQGVVYAGKPARFHFKHAEK